MILIGLNHVSLVSLIANYDFFIFGANYGCLLLSSFSSLILQCLDFYLAPCLKIRT